MVYEIQQLSEQLIHIRWHRTPSLAQCQEFIVELRELVEKSEHGLYFISDMRKGRIIDVATIQRLSTLTKHDNWLGSVAFTANPLSDIFAGTFRNMLVANKESNVIIPEADKALAFLESLQAGLTDNIDWATLLKSDR